MRLVFAFHGIVFFGTIWIMNNYCNAGESLTYKNCSKLQDALNSNVQFWIHCSAMITDYRYPPCSTWCQLFASCFNIHPTRQLRWIEQCSTKFRAVSQRFLIIKGSNDYSSVKVIHVKPRRPFWKSLFTIKLDTCNCSIGSKASYTRRKPCTIRTKGQLRACQQLKSTTNTHQWYTLPKSLKYCLRRKRHRLAWCFRQSYLRRGRPKKKTCTKSASFVSVPTVWPRSSFVLFASGFYGNQKLFKIRGKWCNNNGRGPVINIKSCPCRNSDNSVSDAHSESFSENLMVNFFSSIEDIDFEEENALQNVSSLLETTIQDFKNVSAINNQTKDGELRENVHFTTIGFEDYVVRFAQQQLNGSMPQYSATDNIDLQVRRVFHQNESDFSLYDTQGGNSIKVPAENLYQNDSVVLGVMYKDLHELLTEKTESNKTNKRRTLNTKIISATLYPSSAVLRKSITLVFKNLKPAGKERECVFWKYSDDNFQDWSREGCHVKKITSSETVCVCNHMTHFAVLMDIGDDDNDTSLQPDEIEILKILTYVGMTLSILGAVITVICYLLLTDKDAPLSQIRVSLVSSLFAGQITILAGINATENKGACVTVAALMQYFFMAALCWMLVEGFYLYLFVVKVYNVSHRMAVYHGISWAVGERGIIQKDVINMVKGTPAVLVSISLSIAAGKDGIKSFVSDKYCWLSSAEGLIWIFVSFVVLVELVNVMILVRVIRKMTSMQHAKDKQTEQIRLSIRTCVVLIPLLGVSWLFGLLYRLHKAFIYIFVILNSTQGFFIFILHCVRNSEIRERFKRRIQANNRAGGNSEVGVKKSSETNQASVNEVDLSGIYEL